MTAKRTRTIRAALRQGSQTKAQLLSRLRTRRPGLRGTSALRAEQVESALVKALVEDEAGIVEAGVGSAKTSRLPLTTRAHRLLGDGLEQIRTNGAPHRAWAGEVQAFLAWCARPARAGHGCQRCRCGNHHGEPCGAPLGTEPPYGTCLCGLGEVARGTCALCGAGATPSQTECGKCGARFDAPGIMDEAEAGA